MLLLNLKAPTSFLLQPASLQFESNISLFLGQVVFELADHREVVLGKNRGERVGWGREEEKGKREGGSHQTGTYFTVILEIFRFKLKLS